MAPKTSDELKKNLSAMLAERRLLEAELKRSNYSAELNKRLISALQGALKILKDCRVRLQRSNAIVSLSEYRNILTNIQDSETALKEAQVNLRKNRSAATTAEEELPRITKQQKTLERQISAKATSKAKSKRQDPTS